MPPRASGSRESPPSSSGTNGSWKAPFPRSCLILLCHKISSRPLLSAAPETSVSLKEGPAVVAQKGCDGGGHMPLRPHGERPAAGNPRGDEGLGGRTAAPGGTAEGGGRPGKRR